MRLKEFENSMKMEGLTEATIRSYRTSVKQYFEKFDTVNTENLLSYKSYLVENYKPKSVNLKIQGINKYLIFCGMEDCKMRFVKIQQKKFLENVISNSDYMYFTNRLKDDGRISWYFVIRYLCSTGARISELIQIKIEDVYTGHIDIYGKGGKVRRLYFPVSLRNETISWLNESGRYSGWLFINKFGEQISARGISKQLKLFAVEYGINPDVVYPHSFRHRFAKNFLDGHNDLALLADLLGHESIETTRIYLRQTSNEQQLLIDKIVTW